MYKVIHNQQKREQNYLREQGLSDLLLLCLPRVKWAHVLFGVPQTKTKADAMIFNATVN